MSEIGWVDFSHTDRNRLTTILDFLKNEGKTYSKIIANPPFTKNQDIDHLKEMYNCLSRGGKLVCITSESWVNGTQKKQIEFIDWLESVNADIIAIPKNSFKESGTSVGGRIIIIDKNTSVTVA